MRVLIHTDEFLPSSGPCANRMKVFAEVLSQQGHQVKVLASAANKKHGEVSSKPYQVKYAFAIGIDRKTTLLRLLNNVSYSISSFFASLILGKADIVITTSPPPLISMSGWLIAKIKRARLVYDIRDIWPDVAIEMGSFQKDSFYARMFDFIGRFMYERADLITTVSSGKASKMLEKTVLLTQKDRVMLVSNGFDLNTLSLPQRNVDLSEYNMLGKVSCVYIGNIGLAQGLDVMLDLARQTAHRKVQFLVFGDGADRLRLMEKARQEGINNISFCGTLDQRKIPALLQEAKLSFIPLKSASMKDSVPTKLYEALGLGCPVLLMAQGNACDLLEETGLGVCVSPEHIEQLAPAMEEILDNYQQYEDKKASTIQIIRDKYSRQSEVLRLEARLIKLVEQSD